MHPVLFSIGPWHLSTYGAMVALAYLTAILWLKSQVKSMPGMDEDKFWTMIYALFFGAIAGGKLLYIALEWRSFVSGRMSLIRDFRYGFVFFGGFAGSVLMGLLVRRWTKLPYLATADYFGVALPLGHAVGRLGCLGAGCCYGRPTAMPWGLRFGGDPESVTPAYLWGRPLHPTQLYESAANLAIAAFLYYAVLPHVKKGKLVPGTVFLAYVLLYSAARFTIEFYRGDDRGGFLWGLSPSQWAGAAGVLLAAAVMARNGVRRA